MGCNLVGGYSAVTWCQVARATASGPAPAPADGSGNGFRPRLQLPAAARQRPRLRPRLPAPAPVSRRRPRNGSGRRPGFLDPVPAPAPFPRESVSNIIQHGDGFQLPRLPWILPAICGGDGFRLPGLPALPGPCDLPAAFREPSGPGGVGTASGFPGKCFKYHSARRRIPASSSSTTAARLPGSVTGFGSSFPTAAPEWIGMACRSGPETADFFRKGFYIISITTR